MSSRASKRLKTNSASSSQGQSALTSFFGSPSSKATTKSALVADGTNDAGPTPATSVTSDAKSSKATKSPPIPSTIDPIIPKTVLWSASLWKVHDNAVIYRKAKDNSPPRDKVAAFDMDGTLLTWRTTGWPSKLTDYELWNADVLRKLRHLYDNEKYQLIIVSNQGAIRGAHTGKKATTVKELVEWLITTIDRPISVVLSTDKKKGYHKPSVKLWKAAQSLFGMKPWNISESLFVGDSVGGVDDPQGGVDIGLARNVGADAGQVLRFYTPDDFFGPSHQAQRQSPVLVKSVSDHVLATRAALCSGTLPRPILLMLCGAQGSGKSTFCQRLALANPDHTWVHVSQDTIRNGKPGKREQVEAATEKALLEKKCVMVDRMHLDGAQREPFVQLAKRLTIPVHAIVLNTPKAVVTQRVKERTNHPAKIEGEAGARLAAASVSKLVPPSYEEGFALISQTSSQQYGVDFLVDLYRTVATTPSLLVLPKQFPLVLSKIDPSEVLLPAVVLGTMGIGRRMAEQVVQDAIEIGIGGVDTAPTYNNEDKVGAALAKRTGFVIAKVPKRASTAKEVQAELQASLDKLQCTKVDLLLLHWPTLASDALKEIWQAMEKAVQDGRARALGVCNANVSVLAGLLPLCRIPPSVLQVERHPLLPQWELVDFCHQHDIRIQAHTPLGQGKSDLLEHEVVRNVCARYTDASPAQVVLAWNLQQGVAVVPKASTREHLEELNKIPCLSSKDLDFLNNIKDHTRFVTPPFMFGNAPYCWGKQMPK